MKLAVTQIILGALMVFVSFFIVGEVLTTKPYSAVEATPGFLAGAVIIFTCILGLAVMGIGIAQLVKSRRG